jgi:hypothetical protein
MASTTIKANLTLLSKLRKESFAPLNKVRAALIKTNNCYDSSLELLNSQPASVKLAARSTPQGLLSLIRGIYPHALTIRPEKDDVRIKITFFSVGNSSCGIEAEN